MVIARRFPEKKPNHRYCTILNIKIFINGSCPILVLKTVLAMGFGCTTNLTDAKSDVKNYQGQTTLLLLKSRYRDTVEI